MVLKVGADSGQVAKDGYIQRPQMVRRANSGKHEQLRRTDSAGANNDLPLCVLLPAAAQVLEADEGRPLALKENLKRLDVGAHGQAGARHSRAQKRSRGAVPLALSLRKLVGPEPVLRGSVEIGITLEAGLLRGVHEDLRERIQRARIGDVQRPTCAVIL